MTSAAAERKQGPSVGSLQGIGFVKAMLATSPRLDSRMDMGGFGPITDEWRDVVEKLLAVVEEHLGD